MKLDDVKKLHQKKYRSELGHYLVEGEHLILELHKARKRTGDNTPITLYVTDDYEQWAHDLHAGFRVVPVTSKKMAQISDTRSPQGLVACVPLPETLPANASASQRCIYLHEIQDPGNLGTILRSLAWFGQFRLLLSPNSVDPFNPKVVRASMGAIFHVPMEQNIALPDLAARYSRFAYLDMQGESIHSAGFADFDCYLFGNEARGVPHEALESFAASAFTIAGNGTIDSLNVASALTICAYQLSLSS